MSMIWKRDGTIVGPEGIEIDIRTDAKGRNWITVKGATDKEAERVAALILGAPRVYKKLKDLRDRMRKMGNKSVFASWVKEQCITMLDMMKEETNG